MAKEHVPVVQAVDVHKRYNGGVGTGALRGVNFGMAPGEFVVLMGASGSGKSTLLNMIGALDRPTAGRVLIDGWDTSRMDDDELAAIRGDTLGFIFQFHHLLSEFTVLEIRADAAQNQEGRSDTRGQAVGGMASAPGWPHRQDALSPQTAFRRAAAARGDRARAGESAQSGPGRRADG